MQKLIFIDFETHLISEESPSPKPVCLSFADGHFFDLIVGMEAMEKKLKWWLENDYTLVAHNAAFEANVIFQWMPNLTEQLDKAILAGRIACTKVNEMLLDCQRKKQIHQYGLDKLVKHYFELDISDDKHGEDSWRLRYAELEGVNLAEWSEEAVKYAVDDSIWAQKIYNKQISGNPGLLSSAIPSVQADIYLNYIGQFGITIDQEYVDALDAELQAILDPLYADLEALGLMNRTKAGKRSKSLKRLRELIIAYVADSIKTSKGAIATDAENIAQYLKDPELNEELRRAIEVFLGVMKLEKAQTAFVNRLKGSKLIRSQYKPVVATGRTSSSTSSFYPSVNIQQMPRELKGLSKDIRGCFIPRPGFKICSIDYTGLELSCTAFQLWKETGKRDMLDFLNSGKEPQDPHSRLAAEIYNIAHGTSITYEEFKARKKEPGFKDFRQIAKPVNLGFPGGIGPCTMRKLMAKDGIYPKLTVLCEAKNFEPFGKGWKFPDQAYMENQYRYRRAMGEPVRVRRLEWNRYQLVEDELVTFRNALFKLYPDLEYFLKEGHKEYLTGETKKIKNEYGEWEDEPMYRYNIDDKFYKDYSSYTMACNGLLMQSPAAIGAKMAMVDIISTYKNSSEVNILAFIHDEVVFEVLQNDNMYANIQDIAAKMIINMQKVVPKVRIAVEAELMDRWQKSGGFWTKSYWRDAQ